MTRTLFNRLHALHPLWHAWILDMKFTNKGAISINEGVFSSPFHPIFFLSFRPSFCKIELNTMQNFWQKGIYSPL
jgi:hypothetical protein